MTTRQVGYLVNHAEGLQGERGVFFDYILAGNGLFIEASNPRISARIPVSICDIRGLAKLQPKVILNYGSIPQRFFDLALSTFLTTPDRESYAAVTADAGYNFFIPNQEPEEGQVRYNVGDSVILDIHSHGPMIARFSDKDDKDETGLQLYAVVGRLNKVPVVRLRVGVYGYFWPLEWKEAFDGTLSGANEFEEVEEVIEHELQSSVGIGQEEASNDTSSGVWWHRWIRS